MKKLFSLILTIALLCCGAVAESVDVTGMWYGEFMGMVMTMELKADGVYSLYIMGETEEGDYAFDGANVTCDPGTDFEMILAYDAGAVTLTGDVMGAELTFGREPIEAYVPAAVNTAAAIEDFAGMWNAFLVEMDGVTVDPLAFGTAVMVSVVGYDVIFTMASVEEEEPSVFTFTGELADGVLGTTVASEEISASAEFSLAMLEDGNIALEMNAEGTVLHFYLAPYAEEAAE